MCDVCKYYLIDNNTVFSPIRWLNSNDHHDKNDDNNKFKKENITLCICRQHEALGNVLPHIEFVPEELIVVFCGACNFTCHS